jgi:GNAT superfamily N-acetyltransferase
MSEYLVRPALIADWPALGEITRECDLDVPGSLSDTWTGVVLVAEHADYGVVGFVQCLPGAPDCVVTTMGVLPEHRKCGIAHQLGAALEYVLKGLGYTSWVCFVRGNRDDGWRETLTKWGSIESDLQGFFHRRILPETQS